MKLLRARFTTLRIITLALASSVVLYGVVAVFLSQSMEPKAPSQILVAALLAVGMSLLIVGVVVARGAYAPEFIRQRLGDDLKWTEPMSPGLSKLMGAFFTKVIISSALMETCALLGFILIVMYGSEAYAVGGLMLGGALVTMVANIPNPDRFADVCRQVGLYPPD